MKTRKGNETLVPRDEFVKHARNAIQAAPYDANRHKNLRNPYSGKRIENSEEYYEYLREHVYYRLCDEQIQREYESELEKREGQIKELKAQKDRAAQLESEKNAEAARRARSTRRYNVCLALLLALLVVLGAGIPARENSAYNKGAGQGYQQGYSEGKQEGYSEGKQEGYNAGRQEGYDAGLKTGYGIRTRLDGVSVASRPNTAGTYVSTGSTSSVFEPSSGTDSQTTVYVSRNGLIHRNSNCSGMKYYTEMTYSKACSAGYDHCSRCF